MGDQTTLNGINYGPLAALTRIWAGGKESRIAQSAFRFQPARTAAFTRSVTIDGDQMQCTQSTMLDIYDKRSCDHTDVSALKRVP